MEHADLSEAREGPIHELINDVVASAFDILADLPKLYEKIYADFPSAYNANQYRFGSSSIVKIYDPARRETAKDKSGFVLTSRLHTFSVMRPIIVIQMD